MRGFIPNITTLEKVLVFLLEAGTKEYLFCLYGSEFINALAMELGCRPSLKKAGLPTIFHCDVPIKSISPTIIIDIEKLVKLGYVDDITIAVGEVDSQAL